MLRSVLILISVVLLNSFCDAQTNCNNITADDISIREINIYEQTIEFCIPITNEIDYNVELNNVVQTEFATCEADTSPLYLIQLTSGINFPFILNSWTTENATYTGEFNSMSQLLDSMNVWDAPKIWKYEFNDSRLVCESCGSEYGTMEFFDTISGSSYNLAANFYWSTSKLSVVVPIESDYLFSILNIAENCVDTFTLDMINTSPIECNNITADDISISEVNAYEQTIEFCIPISNETDYSIQVNNITQNEFTVCTTDTFVQYWIQDITEIENTFSLESWTNSNGTFTGEFDNLSQLIDSMNVWDAPKIWETSSNGFGLISRSYYAEYSQLNISDNSTGSFFSLSNDGSIEPSSLTVSIPMDLSYSFSIINIAENCVDNFDIIETISNVEIISTPAFYLYPNPASSFIHIESEKQIQDVEIYNSLGILAMKSKGLNLELPDLPAGQYIVKVYFSDQSISVNAFVKINE